MVTLTYTHDHECSFKGETFQVRPSVSSGAYPDVTILCVETHTALPCIERKTD